MRAPLPISRIMLRTAAVWAAVACSGAADARESKYVAGVDDTDRGGWAARRLTWPALAVAAPAVPAIAAATRLVPTDSTNSRLRMHPPRGGKGRHAAAQRVPLVEGPPFTTLSLLIVFRQIADLRVLLDQWSEPGGRQPFRGRAGYGQGGRDGPGRGRDGPAEDGTGPAGDGPGGGRRTPLTGRHPGSRHP